MATQAARGQEEASATDSDGWTPVHSEGPAGYAPTGRPAPVPLWRHWDSFPERFNPKETQCKEFEYRMDDVHSGNLFLKDDGQCLWRSKRTQLQTQWHGHWSPTRTRTGRHILKIWFDYEGKNRTNKWTVLFDNDTGVDYMSRIITIKFIASWSLNPYTRLFIQDLC